MLGVAVCVFLSATPTQKLSSAQEAFDNLRFAAALTALPAESEVAGFSREQVVSWLSTQALALVLLKREKDASLAFQRLYSVASDWQVPDQYGPKVRTLALEAKDKAQRSGVVSLSFEGGAVRATKDAFGFATTIELTWRVGDGAAQTTSLPMAEEVKPPWPGDAPVQAWGRVLGLGGSTLALWGSEAAPQRFEPPRAPKAIEVSQPVPPPPTPTRGLFFAGVGIAAAGAVALAVGGVFVANAGEPARVLAGVTRDAEGRITSLTQREAFALDAQAQQNATLGAVLLTAGGVAAATGVGLMIAGRARLTPGPASATLTIPLDATFRWVSP